MTNQPRPGNDNPEKKQPAGPRTPYPVEHPGISEQPGTEPDYVPATRPDTLPKM